MSLGGTGGRHARGAPVRMACPCRTLLSTSSTKCSCHRQGNTYWLDVRIQSQANISLVHYSAINRRFQGKCKASPRVKYSHVRPHYRFETTEYGGGGSASRTDAATTEAGLRTGVRGTGGVDAGG